VQIHGVCVVLGAFIYNWVEINDFNGTSSAPSPVVVGVEIFGWVNVNGGRGVALGAWSKAALVTVD
jgi:hypothetical protein